ncbi:hypothetical protein D082_21440 [Synechocystis sp. PCC 6714]|nr:hypothetical protein D082_21440 [Synechocystis sp. PCC 6714]
MEELPLYSLQSYHREGLIGNLLAIFISSVPVSKEIADIFC